MIYLVILEFSKCEKKKDKWRVMAIDMDKLIILVVWAYLCDF